MRYGIIPPGAVVVDREQGSPVGWYALPWESCPGCDAWLGSVTNSTPPLECPPVEPGSREDGEGREGASPSRAC
jgi:hypothetical protein